MVYSAFKIKQIDEFKITVYMNYDNLHYEKTIPISKLKEFSFLSSKPLDNVLRIILLKKGYTLSNTAIISSMKRNLENFLLNKTKDSEGTVCVIGPQFY